MLYVVKKRSDLMAPTVGVGDQIDLEPEDVNAHIAAGAVLTLPHPAIEPDRARDSLEGRE